MEGAGVISDIIDYEQSTSHLMLKTRVRHVFLKQELSARISCRWVSLVASTTLFLCELGSPFAMAAPSSVEPKAALSVRKIIFPDEHSLGSVALMPPGAKRVAMKNQVAAAKGSVTLNVAPNMVLLFAASQYAVLHPKLLNEVTSSGIDAIKISFMSMDFTEDGLCDKALPYASHFSDAMRLDISESDASDAGVDRIKTMPKLRELWAYQSSVRGECLKNIDRFPKLEYIDLSSCAPFHQSDLKYLARLHDLKRLELSNSLISKDGVAVIAQLKELTFLNLSRNKAVADDCLPLLLSLKNLEHLELRETSVSAKGLLTLEHQKLKVIALSQHLFSQSDKAVLTKHFPNIVRFEKERIANPETKEMLSPFLGH